jgi:hypothetical protein
MPLTPGLSYGFGDFFLESRGLAANSAATPATAPIPIPVATRWRAATV